jgi:hypothetical protein
MEFSWLKRLGRFLGPGQEQGFVARSITLPNLRQEINMPGQNDRFLKLPSG